MNSIISMMIIALFTETVIQIFKPVWDETSTPLTVPEWLSMLVGIFIAVAARINMLEGLIQTDSAVLIYLFYIFTGIALGRGPNFVHDLWSKLRYNEETI